MLGILDADPEYESLRGPDILVVRVMDDDVVDACCRVGVATHQLKERAAEILQNPPEARAGILSHGAQHDSTPQSDA